MDAWGCATWRLALALTDLPEHILCCHLDPMHRRQEIAPRLTWSSVLSAVLLLAVCARRSAASSSSHLQQHGNAPRCLAFHAGVPALRSGRGVYSTLVGSGNYGTRTPASRGASSQRDTGGAHDGDPPSCCEESDHHHVTRSLFARGLIGQATATAALVVAGTTAVAYPDASFAAAARNAEDAKAGIERDFVSGRYYVTGGLTPSLYRPDCLFTDPTTRVASVEKYTAAVKILFDPDNSQVDLLSLEVKDDTHVFAKWRLQGYLKFPWHPYVAPYTGTTLYTLDSDGLISRHEETWSISALDAARATLIPTPGPQAANSS